MKFKNLLVGMTMALSATTVAQAETLRIGTEGAWPPFNSVNAQGELVGFDVDIAKALCAEMKRKCTFVKQDWDGIIPALKANKYDAIIASMSITPERQKVVSFSEKYYNTPARFIAKKGSKFTDSNLKSGVIGAQRGTIHHDFLKTKNVGSDLKLYKTIEDAFLDLQSGRIDAIFGDSVSLSEGFLKKKDGMPFEFRGKEYGKTAEEKKVFGEGVGVAVRKGEEKLAKEFSDAIMAIRNNGVYKKISDKYFGFDIY